jgi:hypothetical protein
MTARSHLLLGLLAAASVAAAGSLLLAARVQEPFPHAAHTGLFPLCIGCHIGVETGERENFYPAPETCTNCHDGVREPPVEWTGPTPRRTNLDFEHPAHSAALARDGSPALECAACHTQPDAGRMEVEPPIPARCFSCHAHLARDHFVDADCSVCHQPLAESGLPAARLMALPVPATHERADFLEYGHGALAQEGTQTCTTCHVREQCTSCHVGVPAGSPITELPAAAGRIAAPAMDVRYPLPPSHLEADWERRHGQVASTAACATCHTRESCTSCHLSPVPATAAALPRAGDVAAPGVVVVRRMPESHASPFFATMHGPLAAARPQTCATCHERTRFCTACHEPGATLSSASAPAAAGPAASHIMLAGNVQIARYVGTLAAAVDTPPTQPRAVAPRSGRGFHPPNYVLRHSGEAYGRRLDCSSCHNTQLFCRDCHVNSGRGSTGRLGPGYHNAEPVWLLRHGQAARQTLESCTSCHTQRDCMQCHSQTGAFRVSPHGPGFDARRAQQANPQICRACHLGDPIRTD